MSKAIGASRANKLKLYNIKGVSENAAIAQTYPLGYNRGVRPQEGYP
jgi:hypothetical protein